MLGLHSLLEHVKKGTWLPLRGREGEREGETPNVPLAVDFPQVSLVIYASLSFSYNYVVSSIYRKSTNFCYTYICLYFVHHFLFSFFVLCNKL